MPADLRVVPPRKALLRIRRRTCWVRVPTSELAGTDGLRQTPTSDSISASDRRMLALLSYIGNPEKLKH
jgi:hypothetical protein